MATAQGPRAQGPGRAGPAVSAVVRICCSPRHCLQFKGARPVPSRPGVTGWCDRPDPESFWAVSAPRAGPAATASQTVCVSATCGSLTFLLLGTLGPLLPTPRYQGLSEITRGSRWPLRPSPRLQGHGRVLPRGPEALSRQGACVGCRHTCRSSNSSQVSLVGFQNVLFKKADTFVSIQCHLYVKRFSWRKTGMVRTLRAQTSSDNEQHRLKTATASSPDLLASVDLCPARAAQGRVPRAALGCWDRGALEPVPLDR